MTHVTHPSLSHFQHAGLRYHHFEVIKSTKIDELHCRLIELRHVPSGALVMHVANDDPENLFCLSFQTLPDTSNGVAHILEHTVLCGSEKYPVKDPFFAMQRRSLNTFMNALTGSDFTCYPAASQVPKDFYNLLEVYIDAVFHPLLNPLSFLQEGHRLEFVQGDDPSTPLEYKGIVFNEMKGALSNPISRLHEVINGALFPDITYGTNSGGDPKEIPKLSYGQLCDFHKTYYHPSRCLFFFYGNLPLEGHLDFIATHILDKTSALPPLPGIPLQPRYKEPKKIFDRYPISDDEESEHHAMIAFGWLTCHILEHETLLALSVLAVLLMDTDASPLKHALLRSQLCKQALCYLDDEISEVPFIIILKGCQDDAMEPAVALIMKTLRAVADEGISLESFENALHQLEFHRSEITGDHAPFGLSLFMRAALTRQHGGAAEHGLTIHALFEQLRKDFLANPRYLSDLIHKHLIDNPHFVQVTMSADKQLAKEELASEQALLKEMKEALSLEERENLVRQAKELADFQEKQADQDIDILPQVTLDDIPKLARHYLLHYEKKESFDLYHHPCFTNEIVYANILFNLPQIAGEDLPYLRLFANLFSQVGSKGKSYVKNLEYIQAHLGNFSAGLVSHIQANDSAKFFPAIEIKAKALHRKVPKLFSFLQEMIYHADFSDVARTKELLFKHYTTIKSSLNQNALKYAVNLASSGDTLPAKINQLWYGLSYFELLKDLTMNFDVNAEALIAKLHALKELLFSQSRPDIVLSCDAAIYDEIKSHDFYGLSLPNLPPYLCDERGWQSDLPLSPVASQGRLIASPIAFTAKACHALHYTHVDAPALLAAASLMDNLVLHPRIREQGGAYGAGAISNPLSGSFYLYSYRDPNIVGTLQAFDDAIEELALGNFDQEDLLEAKLDILQDFDTPIAPGSQGEVAYSWLKEGKTFEARQTFRNNLLNIKGQDVIFAVEKHLIPIFKEAATVIFAGKELLEKENEKLEGEGKEPFALFSI